VLACFLLTATTRADELLPGGFFAPCDQQAEKEITRPTQFRGQVTYNVLAAQGAEVHLYVNDIRVGRYNWGSGKSKLRQEGLAAPASVRGLGKREALKRLEMLRT
jgi:hypothetical protein